VRISIRLTVIANTPAHGLADQASRHSKRQSTQPNPSRRNQLNGCNVADLANDGPSSAHRRRGRIKLLPAGRSRHKGTSRRAAVEARAGDCFRDPGAPNGTTARRRRSRADPAGPASWQKMASRLGSVRSPTRRATAWRRLRLRSPGSPDLFEARDEHGGAEMDRSPFARSAGRPARPRATRSPTDPLRIHAQRPLLR
jgi:hypothetical protein